MKQIQMFLLLAVLIFVVTALGQETKSAAARDQHVKVHPELPGIIVDWFVTTLIKTPGHAPADTVASAFLS